MPPRYTSVYGIIGRPGINKCELSSRGYMWTQPRVYIISVSWFGYCTDDSHRQRWECPRKVLNHQILYVGNQRGSTKFKFEPECLTDNLAMSALRDKSLIWWPWQLAALEARIWPEWKQTRIGPRNTKNCVKEHIHPTKSVQSIYIHTKASRIIIPSSWIRLLNPIQSTY